MSYQEDEPLKNALINITAIVIHYRAMVTELRELHEILPGVRGGEAWCAYCNEYFPNCEVHQILDKYAETSIRPVKSGGQNVE